MNVYAGISTTCDLIVIMLNFLIYFQTFCGFRSEGTEITDTLKKKLNSVLISQESIRFSL